MPSAPLLTFQQLKRLCLTALALTAACWLVQAPSEGARAQDKPRARLSFSAPAGTGCPSETELRRAVAARLGYVPFDDQAERRVRARIKTAGSALVGSVELEGASGATEALVIAW